MTLTQEHMRGLWNAGHMGGFTSKRFAALLISSQNVSGTFMMRFTDSKTGKRWIIFALTFHRFSRINWSFDTIPNFLHNPDKKYILALLL